jgi:mannitol/fructose-specific phosphotransferase system IIA component (Ntr-type)
MRSGYQIDPDPATRRRSAFSLSSLGLDDKKRLPMPFVSHLRAEQILIAPPWLGFGETVDGLLDRLATLQLLSPAQRDDAAGAVRAREREASTAVLETGVGVPHARIAGLPGPVVALAVSPTGLYEAVPTVPIRIVALVLSPLAALDDHLRILAEIATLLHSADLRTLLLRARDAPTALEVLLRFSRGMP